MGIMYCLNVGFGDATIIKTSEETYLVDCHDIGNHYEFLPPNKFIRGVFITHRHRDHYSGLQYLKDKKYSIQHLIYCPYDRRYGDNSVTIEEWNEFNNFVDYFKNQGTKLYPAYRQDDFNKPFWDTGDDIQFWMIGPVKKIANSDAREIHDASLVITARLGNRTSLFAGDASDISLEYIATNTTKYCDDVLHASHHGSINGASLEFIKKCNAKYTIISTQSGVRDNVPHPTALKRYKDYTKEAVYRTDISGTLNLQF